jgi:hypothetical protein
MMALALGMAGVVALPAQAQEAPRSRADCDAVSGDNLPEDTRVVSREFRPQQDAWPERCIVRVAVVTSPRSTINIRIDLPLGDAWNGDVLHLGGGGADGMISQDHPWRLADLLRMLGPDAPSLGNYVLIGTDSGHQGLGAVPLMDMTWAVDNPDAVINHGYVANHRALWTGVAIAQQFYGRAPRHRYMVGQSNGGRQGMMAANRFPADYHGVLAIAPAISQEVFTAASVGMLRHIYSHPDNWLGREARALYINRQLASCDDDDGVVDGIIANFTSCGFDPAELLCEADERPNPARCLTSGQIEALRQLFSTRTTPMGLSDGINTYPGYGIGADEEELQHVFGTDFGGRDGSTYNLVEAQVRGLSSDPAASPMRHNPLDFVENYQLFSSAIDVNVPDMAAFIAGGGKMIIWYGASDMIVSYESAGRWVTQLQTQLGRATVEPAVQMYVSPSLGHGMTGNGASQVSLLTPLRNWVENGDTPQQPVAIRPASAQWPVPISRPVCRYGTYARYNGTGDNTVATSFTCAPAGD